MKVTDSSQCDTWYQALLDRASEFTGVFFVGVRTTGVFCISVCRARKPKRENVDFYDDFKSALDAGFRPCKVCRPTENAFTAPDFIAQALGMLRENPKARVSDTELRQKGIGPERVRRWFLQNHGMTFQAFQRMQRVNVALQELKSGRTATDVAFDSGYESLSGFGYTCKKLTGHAPSESRQVILIHRFTTPLGPMFVCATERGICLLEFVDRRMLETEFSDLQRLLKARIMAGENRHTRPDGSGDGGIFCRHSSAIRGHSRHAWKRISAHRLGGVTGRAFWAKRHTIRRWQNRSTNPQRCVPWRGQMGQTESRSSFPAIALSAKTVH
ncbi:DNA-O6-methylguanine--protein-cysteine S-methyltransferase/transcriptional regulator Ada [Lelliottia amnigena]|nr:DNA-O6-methylguanine--protein-cysteine S-methyltransferase/transcriptional regulator Ada [Lelliottia amnigena]